jgi:hypothetical protein
MLVYQWLTDHFSHHIPQSLLQALRSLQGSSLQADVTTRSVAVMRPLGDMLGKSREMIFV